MPHPAFPNLTVLEHPLIQHKLSILRDKSTPVKDFKQLVSEIAMLMTYEVTRDLETEEVVIETPLERMKARRVAGKKLSLVPILRAGLGMVDGITQLVPSARVGHIGLYRDHETLLPVSYYYKVPAAETDRDFFVLDPMLATGGSAVAACSTLKGSGVRSLRFLCIVAAPGGRRGDAGRPPHCAGVRRGARPRAQRSRLHPAGPGRCGGDRIFGTTVAGQPLHGPWQEPRSPSGAPPVRSPARCTCSRPPEPGCSSMRASSRAIAPKPRRSTPTFPSIPGGSTPSW